MRATGTVCLSSPESRTDGSLDDLFTQVWQHHQAEMLRLCRRCTRQEADAEEAFSRASLLLYRKLPKYHERLDNLRGWILRLTFNVCMSLHRENRRRAEQSLDEVDAESLVDPRLLASRAGDPESAYLQKEMGRFLRSSIEELPERLRETVIGHLNLDNYREIADLLAINEANARKRMQEAREVLSLGLDRYHAGASRPPAPPRKARARRTAGTGPSEGSTERVRALRAAVVNRPAGGESEGLLALHLPLGPERRPALEHYIEQHPGGWKKRLALARSLLEEGRAEDALPHLELVVARQPRHLGAWLDLIGIYRLQEQPAVAAEACERALETNRGAAAPLLQGLRAQCLGRPEEAERAFLEAQNAIPAGAAPCVALAELRLANGRPTEAADALEQALARSPTDGAALTIGAEALRLQGRSGEARRRDARALEVDPGNPLALERRLALSFRSSGGRLAPEGDLWRAVERLARTRSASRSLLGFIRISGGDLTGFGETFSRVTERPRCPQAHLEHARLQDAIGRPLAALQEIDAARALLAGSRELDLLACRIALRAGLPYRAIQEIETLLEQHGEAWDIASTAAWALAQLGRTDRAAELSQAAVAHQPGLPTAWLEHGRVLTRCERLKEAAAATEMGWSLLPEDDGFDLATPATLDLARLHRRLGHSAPARHWALQALKACGALGEVDPLRANIFQLWIQAERGSEATPSAAELVAFAPAFLRIEERRLLTSQLAEASIG